MKCEIMNNGEKPAVLFIFAYQIWMKLMKLKRVQPPHGRGIPQLKRNDMAGTPARKRKEWRGLPQEKKKCIWRGLSQLIDDMVGTPTRKGLGLQQMYGVANLISKHEEEENWHNTIKYTGKLDSVKVSIVG